MSRLPLLTPNIHYTREEFLYRLQRIHSVKELYPLIQEFYISLSDNFPDYRFFRETIFHSQQETSYSSFSIPKKNGEPRLIEVPNEEIKKIQQSLNYLLTVIYEPKLLFMDLQEIGTLYQMLKIIVIKDTFLILI